MGALPSPRGGCSGKISSLLRDVATRVQDHCHAASFPGWARNDWMNMARLQIALLKQPRLAALRRLAEGYQGQILLVLLVLYVVVFFWWPLGDWSSSQVKPERRFRFLAYLLLPEEIVELWCGEPPTFAVLDRLPYVALGVVIWGWSICWGWMTPRYLGSSAVSPTSRESHFFRRRRGRACFPSFMLVAGIAGLLPYPAVFRLVVLLTFTATGAFMAWADFLQAVQRIKSRKYRVIARPQTRGRKSRGSDPEPRLVLNTSLATSEWASGSYRDFRRPNLTGCRASSHRI